jgi:NhaP-type Na+/H+ or K+/H+ antiporter
VSGDPLLVLAGLVGGGVAAQWLAWRLRLPVIIVLLVAGVVVGPVLDIVDPDELFGDLLFPAVSLAVGMVLFEGSLRLGLCELRAAGGAAVALVTAGAAVTFALATALAVLVLDRPVEQAALLGAILVVTGPTVVGPLLEQVRPRGRVGPILRAEGILIDPLGAVLALVVFDVVNAEQTDASLGRILLTLGSVALSGGLLGIAGALVVAALIRWFLVPDHLQQGAVIGTVVVVFALADHLQTESGLLAVTVMGLCLANQRRVSVERVAEFNETIQVLLVSVLFLVIAARLDLDRLRGDLPGNLLYLALLVVVVRPVAVFLASIRSALSWRERLLVAWIAPRGIVAAAVSSVFALRLDHAGASGGSELAATVVIVIIGTIALAGLTARPLARVLGLAEPEPAGVLIIGAHDWGRRLAEAFESHGVRALLVERERARATTARLAGRDVHFGSILADHTVETLDTEGIGHLLAITGSDEVNALAAERLRPIFGSRNVWRLQPAEAGSVRTSVSRHVAGRILFAAWATEAAIEARVAAGAQVKGTALTASFDWGDYCRVHPGALVLALLRGGRPIIAGAHEHLRPRSGDVVIGLTDAVDREEA